LGETVPDTVHRTLTLRTALSIKNFGARDDGPGSLGSLLDQLHARFKNIPDRRILSEGRVIEGRHIQADRRNRMTLLHLVAYTPDDQISVVPDAGRVRAADLALVDPPEGTEFLDGELMLLIKDNDVVICRSGLGESALVAYVTELAARHGFDSAAMAFQLMKRADIDKLAMIRRDGIKKVSMNTIAHAAAVDVVGRETVRRKLLGDVLEELKAVLGMEDEVPDEPENLKVEVLFSFDKRNGTELDQRQLALLAERVLAEDEDEGFMIETLSGRKLRAQDIVLSKPVRIRAYGKSIHHHDAWGELREFYEELRRRPG